KPLFFIILALGIVLLSVYVYKNVIHEPEELITMDFSEADDEVSYDFSGTTVALDPGHGGEDPGAPSKYGENEVTIVYSIASTLEQSLTEAGAEVIMTRGADETVSLDDRKVVADLFISLHSDAFDDSAISGFTTFYTFPNQEAFSIHFNATIVEYSFLYNRINLIL